MGFQVQGQTFKAPTAVVMDFEKSKESSMCYVALSRVQKLSQVFIVDKLHEDCAGWRVSFSALDELDDSMKQAINTKTEEEHKLEILCLNAWTGNLYHFLVISYWLASAAKNSNSQASRGELNVNIDFENIREEF